MRVRLFLFISIVAMLIAPASASAYFGHVVTPGESLSSIAAADGLSVSQLAAVNGISSGAPLTVGQTIQIPSQQSSSAVSTSTAPTSTACDGDNDADDTGCGVTPSAPS